LIFDAYGCDPKKLGSMEIVSDALNTMVELGQMNKFHEPYVLKADSNEVLGGKDPGGFSGFVMIHESHISMHTFTKRGFLTCDIYSCKKFEPEVMIKYLKDTFKPKDFDTIKMDRGLKYPAQNIY